MPHLPQRLLLAAATLLAFSLDASGQATLTPTIASTFNIDDEDLDDIDFVEDAMDDGLAFAGGAGEGQPSFQPLTNDEDEEVTTITFAPVDLSAAGTAELNFSWATTGDDFDAGSEFAVTAIGLDAPLFQIQGTDLGDTSAAFFEFFDSPVVDAMSLLDSNVDLTSVVFQVTLDPGFDGDDESIFFDDFSVTTTAMIATDPGDDGGTDDGGTNDGGTDDGGTDDGGTDDGGTDDGGTDDGGTGDGGTDDGDTDDGDTDDGHDDSLPTEFGPLDESAIIPIGTGDFALSASSGLSTLSGGSAEFVALASVSVSTPEPAAVLLAAIAALPLATARRRA